MAFGFHSISMELLLDSCSVLDLGVGSTARDLGVKRPRFSFRFLHSTRSLREEADPKKVKTREMLAYEASQRGEITTARKGV